MRFVRILVVQHDERTRQAINEILTNMDHKLEVAASRAEVRELLGSNSYSCVLLDYKVPARAGCRGCGTPSTSWTAWPRPKAPTESLSFSVEPKGSLEGQEWPDYGLATGRSSGFGAGNSLQHRGEER